MEQEGEQQISKYSSGINIIIRLDLLWKDTHAHSRAGMYQLWNTDLDRIWLELARDIKEEEYEDIEKKFNKFDSEIEKIGQIHDKSQEGFKKITPDDIEKRNKHYQKLMEKQLFLARLENKFGKGTTWDEDDDEDMD